MKKVYSWKVGIIVLLAVLVLSFAVLLGMVLLNEYSLDVTLIGGQEMTLEYGTRFTDPGAQAVYYGSILNREPVSVRVSVTGQVDTDTVGTYELRYRATYEDMTSEVLRTVHVVDTAAPAITLGGDQTVELPLGTEFSEPGYTAIDDYCGDLSDQVQVSGDLDPETPGTYILTYTVQDSYGNSAEVQRTVVYIDTIAPVITLVGDSEVALNLGEVFQEMGYTALDNCDGDMTASVIVEGVIDENTAGIYTLTYTVTDAAGNTTQVTRNIVYKDITPPVLTLYGDSTIYGTIGSGYSDPGYKATDETDGDLTDQVVVTSNINYYLPGTYTVTYTAKDAAGNSTSRTRTVILRDTNANVSGGVIYLTFDDGPSYYTSQLLDVLDKYGVKATFFVVNTKYNSTMTRIVSSGHSIGIHSATHDYYEIYASEEAYFADLYKMQSIIQSYTGVTTMLMRFPGGSSNTVSRFNPGIMTRLTKLVEENGFKYFDWNVNSLDAGVAKSAAESAYNVIKGCSTRSVSVVLMHDSKKITPEATERIIQWGLANGYTFAVLTESSPGCHQNVNN